MTAVLRNNASVFSTVRAELRGGGSGRSIYGLGKNAKVTAKGRYSQDPAAELMPAAEFLGVDPDFQPALEEFVDSPFDPARRRVLGRLKGMFAVDYQSARSEERTFLRRLLMAGNPREGYVANRALHLCSAPHVIRRTLALGVAESRFAAEPNRGFLGAVQARIAATTFRMLGPKSRETVWDLLVWAGTNVKGERVPAADRIIERALILKALAARRHCLGPWSTSGEQTLREVSAFAQQIRAVTRASLATRTTLWAGAAQQQTGGPVQVTAEGARAAYWARGDLDPIYAWQEHGAHGELAEKVKPLAAEMTDGARLELERSTEALPELDRSPLLIRPRLHQALAEARSSQRLADPLRLALTDYLSGRELTKERLRDKDQAFELLATDGFDVASEDAVEAIRQDSQGIYHFDAAQGFGDLMSRYSGATYVRRVFSDQITAGTDPVGQIDRALNQGLAVPLMISETRMTLTYACAALAKAVVDGQPAYAMREPSKNAAFLLAPACLLMPTLPPFFGVRARADAYLAPAALDLLAPPFGLAFPELGIEDRL
jgi:hypothetical protein